MSANASARAFLRRQGRVLEEWMDEKGCFHGSVLVTRPTAELDGEDNEEDGEEEETTEEVWVTGVDVADADSEEE